MHLRRLLVIKKISRVNQLVNLRREVKYQQKIMNVYTISLFMKIDKLTPSYPKLIYTLADLFQASYPFIRIIS